MWLAIQSSLDDLGLAFNVRSKKLVSFSSCSSKDYLDNSDISLGAYRLIGTSGPEIIPESATCKLWLFPYAVFPAPDYLFFELVISV